MKKILFILFSLSIISLVKTQEAKNIYVHPDLSETSNKFDGFLLDFRATKTSVDTFWGLCIWNMDITDFKKTHLDAEGGQAYGGLQTTSYNRACVLTIYNIQYTENGKAKISGIDRIYPAEEEFSIFGQGGKGGVYHAPFDWENDRWYRYFLKSWKDKETGRIFVGQWFQDLMTGKWQLFAYFNTNLNNSFITGNISMYQENFKKDNFGEERGFNIKNIYVHDITKNKWISLPTAELCYDDYGSLFETVGTHEFGANSEFFWGSTGLPVDDQEEYDKEHPNNLKFTIIQQSMPDIFGGISILNFDVKYAEGFGIEYTWEISQFDSPMLSYQISVINYEDNKILFSHSSSRPEERRYLINDEKLIYDLKGKFKFQLEVFDVFGESTLISRTKEIN